jgi:hypothetical protein
MRSQLYKKIFLGWVLLFSILTYINAENFIYKAGEAPIDNPATLSQKKIPGSEIEHPHLQLTMNAYSVIKKNTNSILPFYLIQFSKWFLSGDIQIKKSALLIRKYLAFIFPYHNFW